MLAMRIKNSTVGFCVTGVYPFHKDKLSELGENDLSLSKVTELAFVSMLSPMPHLIKRHHDIPIFSDKDQDRRNDKSATEVDNMSLQ